MRTRLLLTSLFAAFAFSPLCYGGEIPATARTFLSGHCIDCHGSVEPEAGLNLTAIDANLADEKTLAKWIAIHDRVQAGEMPPEESTQPVESERRQFLNSLKQPLATADEKSSEVMLRRLNRREYEYTVCDLFSIDVDVKDMLPEDGSSHGFTTVGESLSISTEQMEAYLAAADVIFDATIGPPKPPTSQLRTDLLTDNVPSYLKDKKIRIMDDGIVMFNRNQAAGKFSDLSTKQPGLYRVKIRAKAFQSDRPLSVSVHVGDVITNRRGKHLVGYFDVHPGDDWTIIEFTDRFDRYDAFEVKPYGTSLGYKSDANTTTIPGVKVGETEIEGPLNPVWPPESRAKLLDGIDPTKATVSDIERILTRVLPQLFRRDATQSEIAAYVGLANEVLAKKRPWIDGLKVSLKAALCSPEFLFLEEPSEGELSDVALASRLSYMLWRSLPDEELLALAEQNRLGEPQVLRDQVERMLADKKAERFVTDFTGQWLELYEIDFTEPDGSLYPEYDELLRMSMLEETHRFFEKILTENLSVSNFIDSDWLIINERLATLYDIDGVESVELREVKLPSDSLRGGLLTQASILKVTANGTNTSPVLRGTWVLERIVGKPAPPPPSNVAAVEPDTRGAKTLRELLAKHRDDPSCARCHDAIDPPGFALESFDVIGGYRDWYRSLTSGDRVKATYGPAGVKRVAYRKGLDVDPTGELKGRGRFSDIRQFKELLMQDPDQITHCLIEKLLVFGTGRELSFSDRDEVDRLVAAVRADGNGLRTLLHHVTQSEVFQSP
ncbi:DUF1592 domain-containing protein [Stratiformator vulcanicus]|uniref:Planctomycete cytochrome C n=1 Tax=Stratiformator vulcanicus TaxID=2527980 RepID=A0A517QXM2_9PLAN|nr:DUF1592 domain-containing protein [Stratiformator vulcanicus]QDT36402.1 hypothetical protein Pan189_07580 [Stratiformator vulcanicus]